MTLPVIPGSLATFTALTSGHCKANHSYQTSCQPQAYAAAHTASPLSLRYSLAVHCCTDRVYTIISFNRCTANDQAVSLCVPLLHDPTETLLTAIQTRRRSVLDAWQHHASHARRIGLLTITYSLTKESTAMADMYVAPYQQLYFQHAHHLRLFCNMLMLASVATPLLINKVQRRLLAIAQTEGMLSVGAATLYYNGFGFFDRAATSSHHSKTNIKKRTAVVETLPSTDEESSCLQLVPREAVGLCGAPEIHAQEGAPNGFDDTPRQAASACKFGSAGPRAQGEDCPSGASSSIRRSHRYTRGLAASSSGAAAMRASGSKGPVSMGGKAGSNKVDQVIVPKLLDAAAVYGQYPGLLRFVNVTTEARYLAVALSTNIQVGQARWPPLCGVVSTSSDATHMATQMRRVVNMSATTIGMLWLSFSEPYKLHSSTTYLRYAMALHSSVHVLSDWIPQMWPLYVPHAGMLLGIFFSHTQPTQDATLAPHSAPAEHCTGANPRHAAHRNPMVSGVQYLFCVTLCHDLP